MAVTLCYCDNVACDFLSACRKENEHEVVFRQKCKRVTGLYLKMLFISPLKLKCYAIRDLKIAAFTANGQGRQSVLKSEGDRLENEEVRGYASLIF